MRSRAIILLLVVFAPASLVACSCAGEMPQLLLDRAQFVAEVLARDGGEFQILRVVRGVSDATDRLFHVNKDVRVEARDCCDHMPHPVVSGNKSSPRPSSSRAPTPERRNA